MSQPNLKPIAEDQPETMTGADMVMQALRDQGVDKVFGYPGGAALPIYDSLFHADDIQHILVRHEQGAAHAAEGYARSTGKVGTFLVTSGPGATNTITGLTDALMDSIPVVCITGQVHSFLIGTDAFQEADVTGITRSCTKHNYLVKDVNDLPRIIHEAYYIARTGRPGPVLIDIPKDVQLDTGTYTPPPTTYRKSYKPRVEGDKQKIKEALDLIATAKKPIFYTGGGVINAGKRACNLLRELVRETGFPITQTLMGLGAYPSPDEHNLNLGMLGMHGTYEANLAMHQCDVMICIGARFDDRVTGKVDEFAPNSKKIHIDVDPSSINKNVPVDIGIIGDAGAVLEDMLNMWNSGKYAKQVDSAAIKNWWQQIEEWRAKECLSFENSTTEIKPQHAIKKLYDKTRNINKELFITTEVGQHQMWAAQHFPIAEPNHWMTSGGLGTMGYGLPAAVGTQAANPDALVIDIAGEASIQMCIQEFTTAIQHRLPVKVFVLNNNWMGMVRQWQQLIHGGRYSQSYDESLPDFVKLAEGYGALGLRATTPAELDGVIDQMLAHNGPVLVDVNVTKDENCYPMIPAGNAHCNMWLCEADAQAQEEK